MVKRVCKDCGREFTISDSEIKFYKDKNFELPKRCSECRAKNKRKNHQKVNVEEVKIDCSQNNDTNKVNNKKSFRNIIIAAIILVASLFGFNFNYLWKDKADQSSNQSSIQQSYTFTFRNNSLLEEHFKKHGTEFPYDSEEDYLNGAIEVINSSSSMHKKEEDDGDEIYYDADKNEIVFVSKDGYIRTYFKPSDGINYYNRQ